MGINIITAIRLKNRYFDVDAMDHIDTDYVEIAADTITTYHTKKGSRTKLDQKKVAVDREKTEAFFEDVYAFIREADSEGITIDDTDHEVRIYYSPYHTEIFRGGTYKDGRSLTGMIEGFVKG